MCLQLVWVRKTHVVFGTLTQEGSQGLCGVLPLGHVCTSAPLNEIKRILVSDRLAMALAAGKQGVKHFHISFCSPPGPMGMLKFKQRVVQGHPQVLRPSP